MTDVDLTRKLEGLAFFKGLSGAYVEKLATVGTEIEIPAGSFVFEEGGQADAAYVIEEGAIALELNVSHRAHHIVMTLHAGELLGWSWLFPPHRWAFSAFALDPTRLIRFDAEQLRALQDADCALGYEMMKRYAHVMTTRLSAARLQLVDVYGYSN
jgi:CRP/FNR family cyclic AMP-dependent transcriptional regulator